MMLLKQSTTTTIQLGPFLDDTDGVTAETGLTVSSTDVYLSKAGAAFANPNDTNAATHDRAGWYRKQLNTTDTNTLGRFIVEVQESGALPVWREFVVVPANVFDSLVGGSDNLEVDAVAVSGDSTAADNLELDYDGTGYAKANSTIGTTTTNTDMVSEPPTAAENRAEMDSNSTQLTAIVGDTNELQGDWVDGGRLDLIVDAILADTNELQSDDVPTLISALPTAAENRTEMDSNSTQLTAIVADTNELQSDDVPGLIAALNDPTAATIADAVWDELATGHTDAGKAGQQLWTDVDAILADTNELQSDDVPTLIAALPTAAENRTEMDSNSTQLAAIVADTNELQSDDVPGLIAALNDPTVGAIADQVWEEAIADHSGTGGSTAEALAGATAPTAAAVADAVWLETLADHSGSAGSTAEALNAAGGAGDPWITALPGAYGAGSAGNILGNINDPTAAVIADAVLDEALSGHVGAGSLGKAVADIETDVTAVLADTNELQSDDVPGLIAALPTAAENRTEMDSNSTQLAAIVADTNELQVDWTNGGRLDLIIDAILTDTNELQADDIPGLIAALNDISAAQVNTQVDMAFTTQMADSVPADGAIPTREQAIYMIVQWLTERAVAGTTVTVKKVDGSTGLMTFTLNDGTSPTSITRAT